MLLANSTPSRFRSNSGRSNDVSESEGFEGLIQVHMRRYMQPKNAGFTYPSPEITDTEMARTMSPSSSPRAEQSSKQRLTQEEAQLVLAEIPKKRTIEAVTPDVEPTTLSNECNRAKKKAKSKSKHRSSQKKLEEIGIKTSLEQIEHMLGLHLELVDRLSDTQAHREALVYWTFDEEQERYLLSMISLQCMDRFLFSGAVDTWMRDIPSNILDSIALHSKHILMGSITSLPLENLERLLFATRILLGMQINIEREANCLSDETCHSISKIIKLTSSVLSTGETTSDVDNTESLSQEQRFGIEKRLADILSTINADPTNRLSSEYLNVTLETVCLNLLFKTPQINFQAGTSSSSSSSLLLYPCVNTFTNLFIRSSSPDLLSAEISSHIPKLAESLRTARNYKLHAGKPILSLSAIVLKIVEARGASVDSAVTTLTRDLTDVARGETSNDNTTSLNKCLKSFAESYHSATLTASALVEIIIDRCLSKSHPHSSDLKDLFLAFTEDLLASYALGEFASVSVVLQQVALQLMRVVDDVDSPAIFKCTSIELLGVIVSKLRCLTIKYETDIRLISKESKSEVAELLSLFVKKSPVSVGKLNDYISILEMERRWSDVGMDYMRLSYRFKLTRLAFMLQEAEDIADDNKLEFFQKLALLLSPKSLKPEPDISITERTLLSNSFALDAPITRYWPAIMQRLSTALLFPQITIRTKALRALKAVATCDLSLLNRKEIATSVGKCIQDKSAQVREAAIDLVTKQAIEVDATGDLYLETILSKTNDPSLAVRKCILRFLRDAFVADSKGTRCSRILLKVILFVGDQSSALKVAATTVLDELLFENLQHLDELKTYTTLNDLPLSTKLHIQRKIIQLTDTLKSKDEALASIFSDYLHEHLKHDFNRFSGVCQAMMDILFEMLLRQTAGEEDINLRNYLSIISTFAIAQPTLLRSEQVALLLPYLSGIQCADDAEMFIFAISVFRRALLHAVPLKKEILTEMRKASLLSMTKLNNKGLREAIPCICMATAILDDFQPVVSVLASCERQLQTIARQGLGAIGQAEEKKAALLLLLVSLFAQNLKFPSNDLSVKIYFPECSTPAVLAEEILNLAQKYIEHTLSPSLKRTAIMSYGYICQGHPKFFRNPFSQQTIRTALEADDVSLNMAGLLILQESFVLEAEMVMTKDEAKAKKSSTLDLDVLTGHSTYFEQEGFVAKCHLGTNFRNSICGELIQHYKGNIFKFAFHSIAALSTIAVEILFHVTTLGLTHPLEVRYNIL